jgi:hypothetical protein
MAMNMDAMLRIKADVQGENNIRRLGNSMQGLQGQVKNTSMAVAGLGAAFRGLGAALAVGGFAAAIKGAIDLADDMRDLSQRTGVGVETLGQFKVAAELSGSSLEGVAKGLNFLNRNMVAAATGGEGVAAAFRTVGVSTTEADGTLRKADKVFLDVADRFATMRDGAEKNALAVKLFGRSGAELIPILNLGSKEIQRFGLGIGPDFANKADAFNDSLGIMKAQVTVLTVQIGSALLPVLSGLMRIVAQSVTFVGNLATEFYKAIGGAAGLQQAAATLIKTMIVLGGVTVGAFAVSNITAFATALRGIVKIMRDLVTLEKLKLAYESASLAISGVIAGVKAGKTPLTKAIGGIALGGGTAALVVGGINQFIDNFVASIGKGLQDALKMPNIPTPPPGTTPDISGLRTGDGGKQKAKDEAARRREALLASQDQLKQSQAQLKIERETNPVTKVALEYAEKRRALLATAAKALSEEIPIEQRANIQRKRAVDLQILRVQEINAGITAFKEFYGAGFEAGMSGELFYISVEKTTSAMEDFRTGIGSYIESIGTLGTNISNITQSAFKGLEDAIVSLTTTGTFNFRQFALSIVEETTRMVTRLMIIAPLMNAIKGLIPGVGGGDLLKKASTLSSTVGFFANGGIIDKPTVFPMANGGAGRFGLMGEAGPEAIMPLRRGRDGRLGVAGGGGTNNITVNVDAKGTSVQGDPAQGGELARAVAVAVQQELIKQQRPGGILKR